ncbi:serrate RNA effector molecule homolog isoform X2 [Schistocerca americana]|uniref:serrate RNA effector molecule homolog isoform X2 n=1 Tax=Schistocerca americana TaxID=7009 RepID=UPI001F4F2D25|nr:serrate RNA effector molecule homolog isoform X2 [Schistocerca americana]XP_047122181.1 serrate RNA effector molecule homolog isoform X2 [Schistocerca piceifrons]
MGDSDDEYDRKRRDKFRGERTESYQRGEGRRGGGSEDRRRDDWIERDSWGGRNRPRTDYRDYRGGGRERYSPVRTHDISPPMKRVRTDWDDRRGAGGYGHEGAGGGYGGNYGGSWAHESYNSQHSYGNHSSSQSRDMQSIETQPPMMSFKAYLQTQDDNITDEEAIRKYNEYKLEFKRQQLNEFFVAHKEEEWFKIKYHPEDSVKRKEEQMNALKNRVNVFLEFLDNGRLDKVSVDADQSEQLIRLLDAVVIRLEGGTDFDLQVLDEPKTTSTSAQSTSSNQQGKSSSSAPQNVDKPPDPEAPTDSVKQEEEEESKPFILGEEEEKKKEREKPVEQEVKKDPSQPLKLTISSEQVELQKKAKEFLKQRSFEEESNSLVQNKKRKREYEYESGSESGDEPPPPGESNDIEEEEPPPPGLEESKDDESELEDDEKSKEVSSPEKAEKNKSEDEADENMMEKEDEGKQEKTKSAESKKDDNMEDGEEPMDIEDAGKASGKSREKSEETNKPRPLHRTASIFLRNLAPTITKQEVEAMCKRYPGFLRVAIADPQPERRWFRRGWVTFERQVNIKEICWNLNNIRLRDCELGAIVNRDLSRRIRTVNGITSHRQVVRNDIKLSARIVHNLDAKCGLWLDGENSNNKTESAEADKKKDEQHVPSALLDHKKDTFGLVSKNPILKNITDYLIEEASAEEEELLGHSSEQEESQQTEETATVERDETLIKVLDKLLLYLRIVHSVDYYNHCEYPNEDEMPNRCGIMHARGIPPSSKVTPQELSDYCRTFEQKIASFLQPITLISDEEYNKLGHKDPDIEVEKFIQANTQELAKDKWLCPLSGKKFKGPEFVRKHIFNKHAEKVEEVKKEVEYFNNYLRDPKRPQLPEHPGNRQGRKDSGADSREGFPAPAPYVPHYQYNYGGRHAGYGGHGFGYGYNQGYNQGYARPNRGGYSRGRGGGEYRPVIHYRDLDAPREPEEFI